MSLDHYDVVVIGSGPGGGSVAHRLAPSGKRILVIERGDYLPRERQNWNSKAVFVDGVYQAKDTWYGADGSEFQPGLHYYVGGNSKVYGAALLRLRERDFGEIRHAGGISPAGRCPTMCSSPITPKPNDCSTCTDGAARTRTSLDRADHIHIRLCRTNRSSRN